MGTKADKAAKPLTRDQLSYARRRIESVADSKIDKIEKENHKWASQIRDEIIDEEIKAGRFSLPDKAKYKAHYRDDTIKLLRFTRYPGGYDQIVATAKKRHNEYHDRIAAVKAARDAIIDRLILADAQAAYNEIQKFEQTEF